MKEVLFLTLEDSAPGFVLTGVRQQALKPTTAWDAIVQACSEAQIGVIAVDSRLLEKVDPIRLRELTDRWHGVLVTMPAPAGYRVSATDELQRLVQRALGYHVRLQK